MPRMAFREFHAEDFEQVQAFAANPKTSLHQAWGPNSAQDTQEFLKLATSQLFEQNRVEFNVAVVTKSDGKIIGSGRILLSSHSEANVGYSLNPDIWGQGYGTETARGLVTASFNQMNARRVVATVGSKNIGSIRVLEKIGMLREAFYEKDVQLRDRWRDSDLYAVSREEFLRQKINVSI